MYFINCKYYVYQISIHISSIGIIADFLFEIRLKSFDIKGGFQKSLILLCDVPILGITGRTW